MEAQLEEILEQQKASWNRFSSGWKKWDGLTMDFLKPMGDEIIRLIDPKIDAVVLDVAAGTGEPGLTIASMLQGGKVVITDLSEEMLQIARENAAKKSIENIETVVCDACQLPFPDNTFDAISCRFGFMFFPDMLSGAQEMMRVLKPGGKIATAVWGAPEKNFWITVTMGTISRNLNIPPPSPDTPGIFRCAKDGQVAGLFSQAGLKNVLQKEVAGLMNAGTADRYWTMITEVAAPVAGALNNADEATREKIKAEIIQALNQKYPDGNIMIDASAWVIYGEK